MNKFNYGDVVKVIDESDSFYDGQIGFVLEKDSTCKRYLVKLEFSDRFFDESNLEDQFKEYDE